MNTAANTNVKIKGKPGRWWPKLDANLMTEEQEASKRFANAINRSAGWDETLKQNRKNVENQEKAQREQYAQYLTTLVQGDEVVGNKPVMGYNTQGILNQAVPNVLALNGTYVPLSSPVYSASAVNANNNPASLGMSLGAWIQQQVATVYRNVASYLKFDDTSIADWVATSGIDTTRYEVSIDTNQAALVAKNIMAMDGYNQHTIAVTYPGSDLAQEFQSQPQPVKLKIAQPGIAVGTQIDALFDFGSIFVKRPKAMASLKKAKADASTGTAASAKGVRRTTWIPICGEKVRKILSHLLKYFPKVQMQDPENQNFVRAVAYCGFPLAGELRLGACDFPVDKRLAATAGVNMLQGLQFTNIMHHPYMYWFDSQDGSTLTKTQLAQMLQKKAFDPDSVTIKLKTEYKSPSQRAGTSYSTGKAYTAVGGQMVPVDFGSISEDDRKKLKTSVVCNNEDLSQDSNRVLARDSKGGCKLVPATTMRRYTLAKKYGDQVYLDQASGIAAQTASLPDNLKADFAQLNREKQQDGYRANLELITSALQNYAGDPMVILPGLKNDGSIVHGIHKRRTLELTTAVLTRALQTGQSARAALQMLLQERAQRQSQGSSQSQSGQPRQVARGSATRRSGSVDPGFSSPVAIGPSAGSMNRAIINEVDEDDEVDGFD